MFYKSTKIVVIGSNVRRKAGPRVGSLGFIVSSDNGQRINQLPGCIVFSASIIFTKYGFEKKHRFEHDRHLLIVPEPAFGANVRKAFNKTIQVINKSKLNSCLMACPIEETTESPEEFAARIFSKLNSRQFLEIVNTLAEREFGQKKLKDFYWNMDRIRASMPDHVYEFTRHWARLKKINDVHRLILQFYYKKDKLAIELCQFINMCEFLSTKVDESRGGGFNRRYFSQDRSSFIANMYKIHSYTYMLKNTYERERIKLQPYITGLTTEIDHRGSLILNKHN